MLRVAHLTRDTSLLDLGQMHDALPIPVPSRSVHLAAFHNSILILSHRLDTLLGLVSIAIGAAIGAFTPFILHAVLQP